MSAPLTQGATAVAALAAVLALIWIAGRMARLAGFGAQLQPRSGRILSVEDAVALDGRRRLHLIRCGGRQVMVLTGGTQDLVVGWLPEPPATSRQSDQC